MCRAISTTVRWVPRICSFPRTTVFHELTPILQLRIFPAVAVVAVARTHYRTVLITITAAPIDVRQDQQHLRICCCDQLFSGQISMVHVSCAARTAEGLNIEHVRQNPAQIQREATLGVGVLSGLACLMSELLHAVARDKSRMPQVPCGRAAGHTSLYIPADTFGAT